MIKVLLLTLVLAFVSSLRCSAADSLVYPRPQRMELGSQMTTVKEVSVRKRGKKSRGGLWSKLPEVKEGYALSITDDKLTVYANDDTGVFYAKQTISQLLRGAEGSRNAHKDPYPSDSLEEVAKKGKLPIGTVIDWPDLPYRGVVEGYYGIPWSTKARMAQLEFYGRNKLNTYIYAPKDDPYHHGAGCYELYPEDKAAELKKVVAHARKNHVRFFWAIHPANTIDWYNQDGRPHMDSLCAKLQQLYELGVRDFGVFVDDSNGEIGKPARQIQLCNYIQQNFIRKHPDANQELIMCPTGYNRGWTNEGVLTEMGNGLPKDIFMMWTGNTVVHDIKLDGQKWVNRFLKSPTFVWWNWPCNDFRRDRLSMGRTYGLGTEEEMKKQMSGFVANPMEHAEASKVGLFGVADYTWNISRFESHSTWRTGIARLYPEYKEEMQLFCDHNSYLLPNVHEYYREESATLAPQLKALRQQAEQGSTSEDALQAIRKVFKDIRKAGKKLRKAEGSAAALAKEIQPWFKQFEMLGDVGDRLLDSCSSKEKKPLFAFLKATNTLAEMKKTTRPQWDGSGVTTVQGVTVGTEHLMPLIEAVLRRQNQALYKKIAKGKPGSKKTSVIPSATSGIRGVKLTVNDTEREISINRIMEFHNLPGGASIELNVPAGAPAQEAIVDLENESIGTWGRVELQATNGKKSLPKAEQRGTALHLGGDALKGGVRKLVLTNTSRTPQQVKIKDFKLILPSPGEWLDARWLTDADLSTSVDCSHSALRFNLGVPSTSTTQVILVGTAEAEISPGKTEKRSGGVLYHNLPKGTRTIEISVKKGAGARLNEIIFR